MDFISRTWIGYFMHSLLYISCHQMHTCFCVDVCVLDSTVYILQDTIYRVALQKEPFKARENSHFCLCPLFCSYVSFLP